MQVVILEQIRLRSAFLCKEFHVHHEINFMLWKMRLKKINRNCTGILYMRSIIYTSEIQSSAAEHSKPLCHKNA